MRFASFRIAGALAGLILTEISAFQSGEERFDAETLIILRVLATEAS
jgi:hypothetical protein